MPLSNSVRAWLFLVPMIPSVIVTTFNLYHLLTDRALRSGIHNHVIILLLSYGLIEILTDITWQIYFYHVGSALSTTTSFCQLWVYCASAIYITIYILMAWAAIERNILVFYPQLVHGKMKRLFFHYIPLGIAIVYPQLFYNTMLFIVPCNVPYSYTRRYCGQYSCITLVSWTSLWDSIAHYMLPAFTTVTFSVLLFVRVVYRRYIARGQIDWRNYKKMTAQLLPISILYMALQFPPMFLYAAYSAGLARTVASGYYSDANFFSYWAVLLTPFASVISLPDLKSKCLKLLFWRKKCVIQPTTTEVTRRNVNQSGLPKKVPQKNNPSTVVPSENENANEHTAVKFAYQNGHQLPVVATVNQHMDQSNTMLPRVE